jgi:hypothetical protein
MMQKEITAPMEKQPKFLRDFSKEQSQHERDVTAMEIKDVRNRKRGHEKSLAYQEGRREEEHGEVERTLRELEVLTKELMIIEDTGPQKYAEIFETRALRERIAKTGAKFDVHMHNQEGAEQTIDLFTKRRDELEDELEVLRNFYQGEKKKWTESATNKEEMQKYFTSEHLSGLSLEEYTLLMQRFPGNMVTHVTRQGVRDHSGMMFHRAGEGAFHNGFKSLSKEGRLRSALALKLTGDDKDAAIAGMLGLSSGATREEAIHTLEYKTDRNTAAPGSYDDDRAVHFATQEVADSYYGAETGNEIFMAYPSAYIANEYHFGGNIRDAGDRGTGNDVFVWDKEQEGIPLDAGIVFIPGDAQVHPETGSQYEINHEGNPIERRELLEGLQAVATDSEFTQKLAEDRFAFDFYNDERREERRQADFDQLITILEKYIPAQRPVLEQLATSAVRGIALYHITEKNGGHLYKSLEKEIRDQLFEEKLLFKRVENGISSKEYWQKYLDEMGEEAPNKVVFYEGADPSRALYKWKEENNIVNSSDQSDLGFPEKHANRTDVVANEGGARFHSIAAKVIREHFDKQQLAA